jgi:hypothetical protein
MITLTITFCMVLNGYICRSIEFQPADDRPITSINDCLMGGAIGSTSFMLEHAEWTVKGWHCRDSEHLSLNALKDRVRP